MVDRKMNLPRAEPVVSSISLRDGIRLRNVKQQIYKLHAEYCQALANPKRLEILDLLRSGELNLETLTEKMKIKRPALSQHLAVLKQKGLVETRKTGRQVYCRLARPKIMRACDIFREVMFAEIEERQKLQKKFKRVNE